MLTPRSLPSDRRVAQGGGVRDAASAGPRAPDMMTTRRLLLAAALFALAQAAPGPNVLVVSLVGWKVAGVPGAIVSLVGICLPSSLLSFWVARWWQQALRCSRPSRRS